MEKFLPESLFVTFDRVVYLQSSRNFRQWCKQSIMQNLFEGDLKNARDSEPHRWGLH